MKKKTGIVMGLVIMSINVMFNCDTSVGPNEAPSLQVVSSEDSVQVFHTATVPLIAEDKDGDPVTFNIISGPENSYIEDNRLIWRPLLRDTGLQTIVVAASDGSASVNASVEWHVWYPIDTCKRVVLLYPVESQKYYVGDTMELIWSLAPQGTDGGLDIAISPDGGMTSFFLSGGEPLSDDDPLVYDGAIGHFQWPITSIVTDGFSIQSTISDSLLIGIQDFYSVDECRMENPPSIFWAPVQSVRQQ